MWLLQYTLAGVVFAFIEYAISEYRYKTEHPVLHGFILAALWPLWLVLLVAGFIHRTISRVFL